MGGYNQQMREISTIICKKKRKEKMELEGKYEKFVGKGGSK